MGRGQPDNFDILFVKQLAEKNASCTWNCWNYYILALFGVHNLISSISCQSVIDQIQKPTLSVHTDQFGIHDKTFSLPLFIQYIIIACSDIAENIGSHLVILIALNDLSQAEAVEHFPHLSNTEVGLRACQEKFHHWIDRKTYCFYYHVRWVVGQRTSLDNEVWFLCPWPKYETFLLYFLIHVLQIG